MQKRRYLRPLIVTAGIIAIYAVLGFLVLPPVLINLARDTVRAEYGRELGIGEIRFNPFTLQLEVNKLSLPDADGSNLLAVDRLLVDLELNSIWRRALSFRTIAVDGLVVNAVVRRGGALNLSDLQPATPAGPEPPGDEPLPRLVIGELAVTESRVRFEDRERPEPFIANIAPITFRLTNFSTYVADGEQYQLDATLFGSSRFKWRGTLKSSPLASTGEFAIGDLPLPRVGSFLAEALPLELASGLATLRGGYRFAVRGERTDFVVENGELGVTDLGIRARGEQSDYVTLDKLGAKGLRVSLADETAEVAEISVAGGNLQAWLNPAGELNLSALAGPPAAPDETTESTEAPAPAADNGWQLRIPRVDIRDFAVNLEDRGLQPAPALALKPLNLSIEGFSTEPGTVLKADLDTVVNDKGGLKVVATTSLDTLATKADVEIRDIGLAVAQPYVARQTSMEIIDGALSAKGQLSYDAQPTNRIAFEGDVSVDRLHTVDQALRKDFVKWGALRLAGVAYQSAPERLRIKSVDVRSPYARVIIGPDGTTNVAAILAGPGAVAGETGGPTLGPDATREKPPAPVTNTEAAASAGTPFPVQVGIVRISDGSARFADLTTRPNFSTGIEKLKGSIKGLSSDPDSRARVELDGQVDSFSPVTIRGEVNPLAAETFLDMAMTFRNVELASFTPYSGRFAGYNIRQGKLSVDLGYKVKDRQLDADHRFVIDQLELGGKVDSPDAVPIPLKLAIALLKDRNGTIDLDLPVKGDLDDPEFRVGPIVWKAFVNLLTKAVTSPFALLGNLVGGGEEINLIGFPPGNSVPDAASQEKLQGLRQGLAERPGLKLNVPAVFSRAVDSAALQESAIQEQLTEARRAELAAKKQPVDGIDYTTLASDPENQLRLLKAAYRKASADEPEPAETPPAEAGTAESIRWFENELRRRVLVTDAELFALAKSRAEDVRSRLLAGADDAIDPARVFLIAPAESKAGEAGVVMELALK